MGRLVAGAILFACLGTVSGAPTSPRAFQAWLASSDSKLAAPIAKLRSGSCGGATLSGEAVQKVFDANRKLGDAHTKSMAAIEATYKIPAAEANDILNGYYISVLRFDYGFWYAETLYDHDARNKDTQPILRGHVLEGMEATQQVSWRNGVFQKEFRGARPAQPAVHGYAGELVPVGALGKRAPGVIEAPVSLEKDGYVAWVDGNAVRIELSASNAPKPCTFVDVNGRKLAGVRFREQEIPVSRLTAASGVGLTRPLHVAALTVVGGYRSDLDEWIATKVARLDEAPNKLDAAQALADAEAQFAKVVAGQDTALASELVKVGKAQEAHAGQIEKQHGKAPSDRKRERATTTLVKRYAWDHGRLRIVLAHERHVPWTDTYQVPSRPPPCPRGAPCRVPPPFMDERVDLTYGVEVAGEYEYDGATGKLVTSRTLPVRAYK